MRLKNRKKTDEHAPWRPDFRDSPRLPDTKPIRTGFLLNFVAIVLAVGLLGAYAFREYALYNISNEVAYLGEQVEENRSGNKELVRLNQQFLRARNIAREAVRFDREPLPVPRFLANLAESLPEGVVLDAIEMRFLPGEAADKDVYPPFLIQLDGSVVEFEGSSPSRILNLLQERLEQLPSLQGRVLENDLSQFNRNNELDVFDFSLQVRLDVEEESGS